MIVVDRYRYIYKIQSLKKKDEKKLVQLGTVVRLVGQDAGEAGTEMWEVEMFFTDEPLLNQGERPPWWRQATAESNKR